MQHIFYDVRKLDAACRETFSLSEDCMMENAAMGMEQLVRETFRDAADKEEVTIFCGSGNNGADGYALARRLSSFCLVRVVQVSEPKSDMCRLQCERAVKCGVPIVPLKDSDVRNLGGGVIVDCIFGSGFHGSLSDDIRSLLTRLNGIFAYKIACDVPTGVAMDGTVDDAAFRADETVCMGALKISLFSDAAKDVAGIITLCDVGIKRSLFESSSEKPCAVLLEEDDMRLPNRNKQNVNKGTFGHACCVSGEKTGAAVIAAYSALRFGAGLVTLVDRVNEHKPGEPVLLDEEGQPCGREAAVPYEIMCAGDFPKKTTAVALGMGLGHTDAVLEAYYAYLFSHPDVACVLDADVCYSPLTDDFLSRRASASARTVITPHPKEFAALLSVCGLGEFSVEQVVERRMELAAGFCKKFPGVVLVLKGANVVIAVQPADGEYMAYINPLGEPVLSKAGSGDVLSGMIAALLAQHEDALPAAQNASLAHAVASRFAGADYSLTPFGLAKAVARLG